jgi:hypothetical protein
VPWGRRRSSHRLVRRSHRRLQVLVLVLVAAAFVSALAGRRAALADGIEAGAVPFGLAAALVIVAAVAARRTSEQSSALVRLPADGDFPSRTMRIESVLPRDAIAAIEEPRFASADEASDWLSADDPVIGISLDGDDRAYGVALLSRHEVVNDVVNGQPLVVTWCPLCYTALAFDREVEHEGDTRFLTFGVSGSLLANALVMYDRETRSLWSQPLGRSIDGELTGTTLRPLAAALTTWGAWRRKHPRSQVLEQPGRLEDIYAAYYDASDAGVAGWSAPDERLGPKELVLAVLPTSGAPVSFAVGALREARVVNDSLAGGDVVVVFDRATGAGRAYRREVDGRALTFDAATDSAGTLELVDRETASRWDAATGRAIAGRLTGQRMHALHSYVVFWFAWSDLHPGAALRTAATIEGSAAREPEATDVQGAE